MNLFACPGIIILALADVTSQLLNIFQSKGFLLWMYFCWLIGFFVKLQVLIKCPFRELQAPSRMTIFEIFLDCLNATLWISILKSVPRRFVKKMKYTKNNENVNFFIRCLSQCFILNSIHSISPLEDKEKTWVSTVFADYTFHTIKNSLSLWKSWKLS